MEAAWIETFYQETDAPKRLELLKQNTENELTQADVFRKKLWVARYGKRKPTKDAFVGSLMELKCLAEGTSLDFGGQRRKQAAKIISTLCLADADSLDEELRENLLMELKNEGMAIFLTTHNMEEAAKLCDNVALLNDGVIVEYGSPQAICLKHNQIKKYRVRLTDGTTHLLLQNEKTTGQIAQWMNSGQLETIHSCEPTLETVFLDTTGRNLQ